MDTKKVNTIVGWSEKFVEGKENEKVLALRGNKGDF